MSRIPDSPTRKQVLQFIAKSASYGNLGLFVGAGFPKAVLNETPDDHIALSWGEPRQLVVKFLDRGFLPLQQIRDEGLLTVFNRLFVCKELFDVIITCFVSHDSSLILRANLRALSRDAGYANNRNVKRSSSSISSGSVPLCARIPPMILRGIPIPMCST